MSNMEDEAQHVEVLPWIHTKYPIPEESSDILCCGQAFHLPSLVITRMRVELECLTIETLSGCVLTPRSHGGPHNARTILTGVALAQLRPITFSWCWVQNWVQNLRVSQQIKAIKPTHNILLSNWNIHPVGNILTGTTKTLVRFHVYDSLGIVERTHESHPIDIEKRHEN